MTQNGTPKRLDTYIDIPLEIGLPHFISDDKLKEEGPLFGNFKLVLQSVVCHRGVSTDSGHYIALVRANEYERPTVSESGEEQPGPWLHFDDLASPRIREVDIKKALREESPYLLFYQVQPIDEELASRGDPPPYAESSAGLSSHDPSKEMLPSGNEWEKVRGTAAHPSSVHSEEAVGRTSFSSNHRNSFNFEDVDGSIQSMSRGRTQPPTPDEGRPGFLSASRRGSRTWLPGTSRSRPSSQSGADRLSLTLSRLTGRGSKEKLPVTEGIAIEEPDPVIVISEVESREQRQAPQPLSPIKDRHEGGVSRSKSKRTKERFRSKSREPTELLEKAEKGKHREKIQKNRPDRECMVM